MRTPRASIAFALAHMFGNSYRVPAVFAVNRACARLFILKEIEAVELRVLIDDPRPPIDADHADYAIIFIGERVDFFGEWIQLVLILNHQERHHLFVAHLSAESGGL